MTCWSVIAKGKFILDIGCERNIKTDVQSVFILQILFKITIFENCTSLITASVTMPLNLLTKM